MTYIPFIFFTSSARYYNIEIKRFINQDTLAGNAASTQSLNRYAYVEGNPVRYLDPWGLDKEEYVMLPSGIKFIIRKNGCEIRESISFLFKDYCLIVAQEIIDLNLITGMSRLGLAQEIFFHAAVYYGLTTLGLDNNDLYSSAKEVNLDNGGDSLARKVIYTYVWFNVPDIVQGATIVGKHLLF